MHAGLQVSKASVLTREELVKGCMPVSKASMLTRDEFVKGYIQVSKANVLTRYLQFSHLLYWKFVYMKPG